MVDVANILSDADNCLLFKNNVEYEEITFMQTSKMTKRSMTMIFSNPILAPIQEYLNYKNIEIMRTLLTKLLYDKVIW